MTLSEAPRIVPVPIPLRGGNRNGLTRGRQRRDCDTATELRQHRDEVIGRSTSRYRTHDHPHSPLWLVIVDWPDERCPTCGRQLPENGEAAWDEDVDAVFCLRCAKLYLEDIEKRLSELEASL